MELLINKIILDNLETGNDLHDYFYRLYEFNEELFDEIRNNEFLMDNINKFDYKGYGIRKRVFEDEVIIELVKINKRGKDKFFMPIVESPIVCKHMTDSIDREIFNCFDLIEFFMGIKGFYLNMKEVMANLIRKNNEYVKVFGGEKNENNNNK